MMFSGWVSRDDQNRNMPRRASCRTALRNLHRSSFDSCVENKIIGQEPMESKLSNIFEWEFEALSAEANGQPASDNASVCLGSQVDDSWPVPYNRDSRLADRLAGLRWAVKSVPCVAAATQQVFSSQISSRPQSHSIGVACEP